MNSRERKRYLSKKFLYADLAMTKRCFLDYLNIGNSNKYVGYLNGVIKVAN